MLSKKRERYLTNTDLFTKWGTPVIPNTALDKWLEKPLCFI